MASFGARRARRRGAQMRDNEAKLVTGESFVYGHLIMLNVLSRTPSLAPGFGRKLHDHFLYHAPGPKGVRFGPNSEQILKSGMYCCQPHTIPYQHTLSNSCPDLYKQQEKKYMKHLKEWREHANDRRWYRAPFYYTILTLHDINTPASRSELHKIAVNVNPSIATKWQDDDRVSRARNLAAHLLLEYR